MNEQFPPVCLFIFNRPEPTTKVFEQIRSVEPSRLYVVADGPRANYPKDAERCREARTITEGVDWNCEVHRDYAEVNMGLKQRFTTGLEFLFEHEDRAIILEDDCVPHTDFFNFCTKMLEHYAEDERVWDVSGTNYLERWHDETQDYHFSYYGGIWGWATWRRAWKAYDPEMNLWADSDVRERIRDVVADDSQYEYLRTVYERTYNGDIETWDYQWGFARHINSGLSVIPSRNLVSNVGFGSEATNTVETGPLADIPRHPLSFPLDYHDYVAVDRDFDREFHRLRTKRWERIPSVRRFVDRLLS